MTPRQKKIIIFLLLIVIVLGGLFAWQKYQERQQSQVDETAPKNLVPLIQVKSEVQKRVVRSIDAQFSQSTTSQILSGAAASPVPGSTIPPQQKNPFDKSLGSGPFSKQSFEQLQNAANSLE